MTEKARTLADYRPRHDNGCGVERCACCDAYVTGGHITSLLGHEATPKPCTCGLDALLAVSLPEAAPALTWQPIETAKREPVAIIGGCIKDGAVLWCCAVMWMETDWVWESPPDRDGSMSCDAVHFTMPVTHWMPLPPAPQETTKP